MFMKTILIFALTALASTATAENARMSKPAGGSYQAVSDLVPLPNHIPGIGTLYVDPATLPAGPFAAYNKKGMLVSTVYMIPLADMQAQKKFGGLEVAGLATTSVDMYYNAGHPGVDKPHYHIVLWHVDAAMADVK